MKNAWLIGRHEQAHEHESPELRAAYERGRRDERARHHKHPLTGLAIAATALVGGAALALAALQGSFQSGGEVLDRQIATAAEHAEPVLRNAAGDAGQAIHQMGRDLTNENPGLAGG